MEVLCCERQRSVCWWLLLVFGPSYPFFSLFLPSPFSLLPFFFFFDVQKERTGSTLLHKRPLFIFPPTFGYSAALHLIHQNVAMYFYSSCTLSVTLTRKYKRTNNESI
jgi:hypothetical protein